MYYLPELLASQAGLQATSVFYQRHALQVITFECFLTVHSPRTAK
jgi:hypothetical protein